MTARRNVLAWFALLLLCGLRAFAGGPLLVASNGVPQTWANGQILYYTDQGDLSPQLPLAKADQFVADAWSQWTSVPLAQLTVIPGGRLSEDVTGANFAYDSDLAANSGIPLAIVYDQDGSVIAALLGDGAGSPDLCSTNAVYEQVDGFSESGNITHALVVINGNCAVNPVDLPVLKYQLVRALGRVLGLDYSQLNENVVTGTPAPTNADYAGYPVMHPLGVLCTYDTGCMVASADVPRMDDRSALARLYPADSFAAATGRVSGTVRFPIWRGVTGQAMQGVNVVARLIDSASGLVSTEYSASSVTGFRFRGNAGNPVTGYVNALGEPWDARGSSDPSLEGFYDLAGLEIPEGHSSATYQISVEPVNPLYNGSTAVGPYVGGQVTASGTAAAVIVTIAAGAEVTQDFTMQGGAAQPLDRWEPSSFAAPTAIPLEGSWTASLSGYGDRDYYVFNAQANRTFTFDVMAIDEHGAATVNKALPVIGLWSAGTIEDTPQAGATFFNVDATATTRLQQSVSTSGNYLLGVMDYRGDGRPDFGYTAHLFYADNLSPAHLGVQGGSAVTIAGFGFTSQTQVSVNGTPAATTYVAPNQIMFQTPVLSDGTYSVLVTDGASGATSQMIDALTVGAANAKLLLVNGANPAVPVGTVAPNAFTVQVVDNTSGIPVAGATVMFSAPASVALVGCSQNPCQVITDLSGLAAVQMLVAQAGSSVVSAALVTGGTPVYEGLVGVASSVAITLPQPTVYVVSGATLSVPISAQVVVNGTPTPGQTVNFLLNYGSATVAPASAFTGANGTAAAQVSVSGITATASLSACVAPANSPCRIFTIQTVASSGLRLKPVSGNAQTITTGQSFAPLIVRVTDGSGDPIMGVPVSFDVHVCRTASLAPPVVDGETVITRPGETVVLSSSAMTFVSDANGMASLPAMTVPAEPVTVNVRALAGTAAINATMSSVRPAPDSPNLPANGRSLPVYRPGFNQIRFPDAKQK